ncbi:MAG: hypothetical protein FWH26_05315 [Oscillospiraceae bacterium]|nr:hypothetical protein [Oscillospiraceae bacterium]
MDDGYSPNESLSAKEDDLFKTSPSTEFLSAVQVNRRKDPVFLTKEELDSFGKKKDIEDKEKSRKLARQLVRMLIAGLSALLLCSAGAGIFSSRDTNELTDKVFQILQAALFTLLGYLFGEKSGKQE